MRYYLTKPARFEKKEVTCRYFVIESIEFYMKMVKLQYCLTKLTKFDTKNSDQTSRRSCHTCQIDIVSPNLLELTWKVIKPQYCLTKRTTFGMKHGQSAILSH